MKELLLGAAFLFATTGVFAQLTVKPTTNGEPSFMYVKDQVVYVEGGIKLDPNTNSDDYEASIYLRDNGQLIQGDHAESSNSGDGYLSVQQKTEPTNAYAYYHWASPVGNNFANTGTGNIEFGINSVYQALGTVGGSGDNDDLAIGTKAQKAATVTSRNGFTDPRLTISTRWLYIRPEPKTESEAAYQRINSSDAVPPGFGFTMKGVHQGEKPELDRNGPQSAHEQIYEFRGRPNSGTFNIPVQGPVHSSGSDPFNTESKMTLAGNPYPSALDLNWVFNDDDNAGIDAFHYYDADRTVMSHFYSDKPYGFATWIPSSGYDPGLTEKGNYTKATFYIWNAAGTATSGNHTNQNEKTATRIAPIGQGIMFVGNTANSTDVKIKNSHRRFIKEEVDISVFHRPEPNGGGLSINDETGDDPESSLASSFAAQLDTRTPKLRLYVVFDNALTRDLLITFHSEATDGFDRGYDAPSPMGMNSDAFFPIMRNDRLMPFVINGTNYEEDKRIPIAFMLHKQSSIRIKVAEEVRKPYQKAYLYDNVNQTYRPLAFEELASGSFTLPAGEYLDRFFIVFNKSHNKPWKSEDIEAFKAQVNVFQNNPSQQLEIQNPNNYDIKAMNMFDMTGKLVISQKNLGKNSHHSFRTGNLSDGVYVVNMTTTSDMRIDYKVVVMNK